MLRDFLSTAAIGRPTDTKLLSGAEKHPLFNCQKSAERMAYSRASIEKSPPPPSPWNIYIFQGEGDF